MNIQKKWIAVGAVAALLCAFGDVSGFSGGAAALAVIVPDENQDGPRTPEGSGQPGGEIPSGPERKFNKEEGLSLVQSVCGSQMPYLPDDRREAISGFDVIEEDVINAYADQKGKVTFFTGILNFSKRDDEVAIICGHEMAHVTNQHIKKSTGTAILATVAGVLIGDSAGDTAGNVAASAIFGKKSRSHERDADETGLFFAWNAGWDPRAAVDLWKRMAEESGKGNTAVEKYLSTHPASVEREENFKVFMVRECRNDPARKYCDEILANEEYLQIFGSYEGRK